MDKNLLYELAFLFIISILVIYPVLGIKIDYPTSGFTGETEKMGPVSGDTNNMGQESGSTAQTSTASQLTGTDRDLYQQIISILANDPEYNRLGYSQEQFQYLVTKTDWLSSAILNKNPDIERGDLELVVQIRDMEGYRGSLIQELKANKEFNQELGTIAGYTKDFIDAIGDASYYGIMKTFVSIGADAVLKQWSDDTTNHAFNALYSTYRQQRVEGRTDLDAFNFVQDTTAEIGSNAQDWFKVFGVYSHLNDQAELNWNAPTINKLIGKYLESRYRTVTNGKLENWEIPVNKPEDAMENLLRETLHALKMKNIDKLTWMTNRRPQPSTQAVENPEPEAAKDESLWLGTWCIGQALRGMPQWSGVQLILSPTANGMEGSYSHDNADVSFENIKLIHGVNGHLVMAGIWKQGLDEGAFKLQLSDDHQSFDGFWKNGDSISYEPSTHEPSTKDWPGQYYGRRGTCPSNSNPSNDKAMEGLKAYGAALNLGM
jgi:hypothetical protein